jgi:DegV family protein with EDD domain
MNEYVILSDSSCDLPAEMVEALDLRILPLTVSIDGAEYADYPDERELSTEKFYGLLRSGLTAVTSAANAEAFLAEMTPILESGKDILYIGFSSALSGTFQNAGIAAEELREKYPERTLHCVDSRCASMGQGLLLTLTVAEKNKGRTCRS